MRFLCSSGRQKTLAEECSRLKARVDEVEGTMKETLELVDKLQTDLGEANTSKLALKSREKIFEDEVSMLQCQVQELQSQAEKA